GVALNPRGEGLGESGVGLLPTRQVGSGGFTSCPLLPAGMSRVRVCEKLSALAHVGRGANPPEPSRTSPKTSPGHLPQLPSDPPCVVTRTLEPPPIEDAAFDSGKVTPQETSVRVAVAPLAHPEQRHTELVSGPMGEDHLCG